jgi:DNA-binding IscR family transcriptional regulator
MQADIETPDVDVRRAVLAAFDLSPFEVWTRGSLARRYGVPASTIARVLIELEHAGLIRRLPGPDGEYAPAGADLLY